VSISDRPLSCLECLLYDEREKRGTRAAEIQTSARAIVGVNLCLVRRLFSRLFTRPRQCRRRRGARVPRPAAGPRAHHDAGAHTSKVLAICWPFFPRGVIESVSARDGRGSVKECHADERAELWMVLPGSNAIRYRWNRQKFIAICIERGSLPSGLIIISLAYLPRESLIDVIDYVHLGSKWKIPFSCWRIPSEGPVCWKIPVGFPAVERSEIFDVKLQRIPPARHCANLPQRGVGAPSRSRRSRSVSFISLREPSSVHPLPFTLHFLPFEFGNSIAETPFFSRRPLERSQSYRSES